jgi:hypothetical protein
LSSSVARQFQATKVFKTGFQPNQHLLTKVVFWRAQYYKTPNHFTFDFSQKKGSINQIIDHESISLKINELLVVKYYFCQA